MEAAVEHAVPLPVISSARSARLPSWQDDSPAPSPGAPVDGESDPSVGLQRGAPGKPPRR